MLTYASALARGGPGCTSLLDDVKAKAGRTHAKRELARFADSARSAALGVLIFIVIPFRGKWVFLPPRYGRSRERSSRECGTRDRTAGLFVASQDAYEPAESTKAPPSLALQIFHAFV